MIVTWQEKNSATSEADGGITQSGAAYYGRARSVQEIVAPGEYFEYAWDGLANTLIVGLSNAPVDWINGQGEADYNNVFTLSPTFVEARAGTNFLSNRPGVAGATYRIEIALNGDILFLENGVTYHTVINPSKTYPYFLVFFLSDTAQAGLGLTSATTNAVAPTPPVLPNLPSNFNAVPDDAGGSTVAVSWTDENSAGAETEVYRRIAAGAWALLATVAAGTNLYSDTGRSRNVPYDYKIRAKIGTTYSAMAIPIPATIAPAVRGSIKNDNAPYAPPLLSSLTRPAGGQYYYDPVFGTRIMRFADENDDASWTESRYSYWTPFNYDNTRVLVYRESDPVHPHFYEFDPVKFRRGARSTVPVSQVYADWGNGYCWSRTDPDVIYVLAGAKLYSYNVATGLFTLYKDFTAEIGAGRYLFQPSWSEDLNVIGATIKLSADYSILGRFAYKFSTATILLKTLTEPDVNEVHVGKEGRWIETDFDSPQRTVMRDTLTGLDDTLDYVAEDGFSHNVAGYDAFYAVTAAQTAFIAKWNPGIMSPQGRTNLVELGYGLPPGYAGPTGTVHLSNSNDDRLWVYVSVSDLNTQPTLGALKNEVFGVQTTGSGLLKRFVHHRCLYNGGYSSKTTGAISRNGKLCGFTSNWDNTERNDLHVVEIENPLIPLPPPPPPVPPVAANLTRRETSRSLEMGFGDRRPTSPTVILLENLRELRRQ